MTGFFVKKSAKFAW